MIEAILGMGVAIVLFLAVLSFVMYFLPAFIAFKRDHKSKGGIAALNILLGWTVLVWVICLVWSLSDSGQSGTTINVGNIRGAPDDGPGSEPPLR